MSSLINLKMGLVIGVLLLQRDRETEIERENEMGTSYWFTGSYPTIQWTIFHWLSGFQSSRLAYK